MVRLSDSWRRIKQKELEKGYYPFMEDQPRHACLLEYRFVYQDGKKQHIYSRCWLNRLELALAGWCDEF